MKTRLKIILRDVRVEVEGAKVSRPLDMLKDMIEKAPALRPFGEALKRDFGLIAEIKAKSPSAGTMRAENVRDTVRCYESNSLVHAVSVLTNSHFGMSIDRLAQAKRDFSKPILRKDFILDEYQIYEARAFGADAILLMGNILNKGKLQKFWQVAQSLGLEVLFEAHTKAEIKAIPSNASIYGINCRLMDSSEDTVEPAWYPRRLFRMFSTDTDVSRFNMITALPPNAVKVAESGIYPNTIKNVRDRKYNAALVGTALLTAPEGLQEALAKFERALYVKDVQETQTGSLEHAVAS